VKQCPQEPKFEEKAQRCQRALFRKFDFFTGSEESGMRLTLELDDALAAKLTARAAAEHTTPEALTAAMLALGLEDPDPLDAAIAAGEADLAAGRTIPHEAVMAELDTWLAGITSRAAQ